MTLIIIWLISTKVGKFLAKKSRKDSQSNVRKNIDDFYEPYP